MVEFVKVRFQSRLPDARLLRLPVGRHPRKQGGATKVQGSYEARLRKALEKREEEVREETS